MNNDLISRNKLKKHYAWWRQTENGRKMADLFDEIVDAQPTADVVERKKGKWVGVKVGNGTTRYTCSECGQSYECDSREAWDFIYCPKCGMEDTP